MGQAKRRGTYEERKAQAIDRDRAARETRAIQAEKDRIKLREEMESATPEEREKMRNPYRRRSSLATLMMMGAAMAATMPRSHVR